MRKPLEFSGRKASGGYARGLIWSPAAESVPQYRAKGSPQAERAALEAAIGEALERTMALIGEADEDAADILAFQAAMLEDDELSAEAFAAIDGGATADTAWRDAMEPQIAGYENSPDEYFRARCADMRDIRDRVAACLSGSAQTRIPAGAIVLADDLTPSMFLGHDWTGGGIALREGSATAHVAMLARQRGVPAIVGVGETPDIAGHEALLDAEHGVLTVDPLGEEIRRHEAREARFADLLRTGREHLTRPAATANGEAVQVLVNVAEPSDTASVDISHVDGCGLMRTEFLFANRLPDEEEQYAAYRQVLEWAGGKPVVIRTVDAGGDKPVPGLTEAETNPFLGLRGIRLSLAKPDIFAVQVRALLRAGMHGNLKVMLPMVSVPEEIDAAIAIFEREADALVRAGIAHALPPVGIMVEVPSVAVTPQRFGRAAFFSIGSNDLTQYVLAASRDNGKLAHLARGDDPAVLALIANVARHGRDTGKPVSLCGDAASDPGLVPLLLAAGLRSLSVAAAGIGIVKAAIALATPGTAA
jgi:phosphotransferase system enzyme I (PtsI)